MNEVLQAIRQRRSIRNFLPRPVPQELLEEIAAAGTWAPSGMNTQSFKFVVITNPQLLSKLSQAVDPESCFFYGAPALILAANRKDYEGAVPDCAAALQTMFLAAHSLGISSCWVSQLNGRCDEKPIRELLTQCSLPKNYAVFGAAALGYAKAEAAVPARRENTVLWVK